MKICTKCKLSKSENEFYERKYKIKDGSTRTCLTPKCKPCQIIDSAKQRTGPSRTAYLKYQKDYQSKHKPQKRIERLQKMDELKARPCADCNGSFPPECMDWDHIDPTTKSFSVSQAVVSGNNWGSIIDEIAKCRLICANCHRIRTARQQGRYNTYSESI